MNGQFNFDGRELITLRGYDVQSGLSRSFGDPLIAKYSMEVRYPLSLNPNATIYGLAFLEAGNTFANFKTFDPFSVNRAAGVGVRAYLPMFGMLGVDLGWGFDPIAPGKLGFDQLTYPSFGIFPVIGVALGDL